MKVYIVQRRFTDKVDGRSWDSVLEVFDSYVAAKFYMTNRKNSPMT